MAVGLYVALAGIVVADEVFWPPWQRDRNIPVAYPPILLDADGLASRYGKPGYEVIALEHLSDELLVTLRNDGNPALTALLEEPQTAWRRSHVPHALPLDPRLLLDPDGSLPEGPVVRERLGGLGPREATRVDRNDSYIVMGGTSEQLALTHLLLTLAAVDSVLIYPGEVADWCSDQPRPTVHVADTEEMSAAMLADGDLVVIDVRHGTDFASGRLPGSLSLPMHLFDDGFDALMARERPDAAPATTRLVFLCYGPECVRSREACTRAAHKGWLDLWWYRGGVELWTASGRSLATD
jgi:rhodanese-related sulfurtransferase